MDRYVPLPPLPARINRLNDLASDLWWSWSPGAREVFRDLDYPLWRFTDHNPVLLLHLVEPERLEWAAADPDFLRLYDAAVDALDLVRAGPDTWWQRRGLATGPTAWIAPQFALHQSLPVHTTADGVLSGDAAKEASDIGLPFVGVGLMYPKAYPHQRLTSDGWQQESIEYVDWSDAPISPALRPDGTRCALTLDMPGGPVAVAVWEARVGRSRVFLLDTDVPENQPWNRDLCSRASAAEPESRLRQSVLLGLGAVAALTELGIEPAGWHLSGPQAASVILERVNRLVAEGSSFEAAAARVRVETTFGVRVDEPSACDSVPYASLEPYIARLWTGLAPHRDEVFAWGRHETDRAVAFHGAVLGARRAASVSVADEGLHLPSWIPAELARVFEAHVGEDWRDRQDEADAWSGILRAPDEQIWTARERLRGYLVAFMRERARRRWAREQATGSRLVALGTLLDESTLTIGCCVPPFGEGGTTDLLFEDVDRLARIATGARRPVQMVFAGRVHSGDDAGKHQLQKTFRQTLDPAFGGRLAFLEDYDLHVSRLLVQGCDVWLPLPPARAGTSVGAMKAAVNGAAVLGSGGWPFTDARSLYSLIEEVLVPAFYDRNRAGVPERWTSIVRETIAAAAPRLTARRSLAACLAPAPLSRT